MSLSIDQYDRIIKDLDERYKRHYSSRVEIGVSITKKCPVGCRHCVTDSLPSSPGSLDSKTHRDWMKKVSETGIYKAVNITGGEPFLEFDKLLNIVKSIREYGMLPSVVTSAVWAKNDSVVRDRINRLIGAGLFAISVSVDEFHQEMIPFEHVSRVLRHSKQHKLRTGISLVYFASGENPAKAESELVENLGEDLLSGVEVIKGGIIKAGRASYLTFPECGNVINEKSYKICKSIGPVILEDGIVAACCGATLPRNSPLLIGHVCRENFFDIYKRFEEHPILPFLEILGLTEMLKLLRAYGLGNELKDYEDSPEELCCELCLKMFSKKENVDFFTRKFFDDGMRRELGIRRFFMYGDPNMLLTVGVDYEHSTGYQPQRHSRE